MQTKRWRLSSIFLLCLATTTTCVPISGMANVGEGRLRLSFDDLLKDEMLLASGEIVQGDSFVPAAEPFVLKGVSKETFTRSLVCLTAAVYYEARSEDLDGQRAVAQVVLNRARHKRFPSDVCEVVFQGSWRRTGCQFSFTCDGSIASRREERAWKAARKVARSALLGYVYKPVGLATHYHSKDVSPYWSIDLRNIVWVGAHGFYRWHGRRGDPSAFVAKARPNREFS